MAWAAVLLLVTMLSGCRPPARRATPEGRLEVSWTGKDRGHVSGAATARWCELLKVLEIQAVQGDTGVAVAIYPVRTPAPGAYRVMAPARAESLPPSAAVAVRWLGQTVVQGFRGESGQVVLQRSSDGLFSGRLSTRTRSVVDTQQLTLSGTFRDLTLKPDSLGCTPTDEELDQDAETVDTGVH